MADSRRNGHLEGAACSLDDEVLWPILERVRRGTITVRVDEYGWPWYYNDGRHCPFSGYVLEKLVEQGYARWDSHVEGPKGTLIVRDDGLSAVVMEDKGHEMHKRLSAERVLGAERAACVSSPACRLVALSLWVDNEVKSGVSLLKDAKRILDQLDHQSSGLFSADSGRLASYAASSYIWLGQPGRAVPYAQEAIAFYRDASPSERSPTREAISRLPKVRRCQLHASNLVNNCYAISALSKPGRALQGR